MTHDTTDLDAYRQRAQTWLEANAPRRAEGPPRWTSTEDAKAFQARLYEAGYVGIQWPAEYGGQGLTEIEARIFEELSQRYDLPFLHFSIGLGMCAPTLLDLGTEEQKKRYVPKLVSGEEIWCQLFSEPNAGSDVAGLQTRAEKVDGGWRLNGQKVWTSGAQYCEYGLIVTRTDPTVPKHQGITMFILDMHAPGVTVRPLRQITGVSPFNEIFIDDVFVPDDALISEVNKGWPAAITMLGYERTSVGSWDWSKPASLSYAVLSERLRRDGKTGDPAVRRRLAELYAAEHFVDALNQLHKEEWAAGRPPGQRGSVAKLAGTLQQTLSAEIAYELVGSALVAWDHGDPLGGRVVIDAFETISSGIAGGSNEIQRNIIGERVLGLPSEPRVDRDIAFNQVRQGTTAS